MLTLNDLEEKFNLVPSFKASNFITYRLYNIIVTVRTCRCHKGESRLYKPGRETCIYYRTLQDLQNSLHSLHKTNLCLDVNTIPYKGK